ncbi:MAG TPA: hypothetical protein VGE02_14510 [Gemmatimonadales bacterium]
MRLSSVPAAALGLCALLAPSAAAAQGTVSSQGLGYPPGQYSTLSLSTGGAVAEFDPASATNPASVANLASSAIFLHFAPERRRVTTEGADEESRVQRFPLLGIIVPVGPRAAVGVTSSTLLDRTWASTTRSEVGENGRGIVEHFSSRGAINDVRVAGGYSFSRQLQLGLGAHALVGSNQLSVSRIDQIGGDAPFEQTTEVSYSGLGASAGLHWNPSRLVSLALSGTVGATIRARVQDSTIAEGTMPARGAVSARYSGLTGAVIAARAAWQGWSSLDEMGGVGLDARDTWEYSLGADVEGPRIFGSPIALRAGGRWRDLPFAVAGEQPTERAVTGGLGFLFGGGRVMVDLAVERARREAAGAEENAWTFGAGVTVRP